MKPLQGGVEGDEFKEMWPKNKSFVCACCLAIIAPGAVFSAKKAGKLRKRVQQSQEFWRRGSKEVEHFPSPPKGRDRTAGGSWRRHKQIKGSSLAKIKGKQGGTTQSLQTEPLSPCSVLLPACV